MLSKFTTVPLEDLATFEMGQSPPSIYVSEDNIGLPFLQGNAEFGAIYPNHIYHCSKPKKLCRPQDVLISVRAPVGALNKADQVYVIGRGLAAIKFTEIESDFGWHLLNHWARDLQQVAQGSTFKAINKDNLATLQVLLPPLPEQHRIAEILDAADDAIRQTERVVAKLRQAKAGLLHDLLTCGLDAHGHLRDPDAHPEQFKDSPLGKIPKEWGVKTIDDLAVHIGSGATPRGGSEVYQSEGVVFVRSQNVTFEGLLLEDVAHISNAIHQNMARSEIFAHDVLLNITGASIGRCCPVPEGLGLANVNQHVCAIRLPDPNHEDAVFLSMVLASNIGQHQIDQLNAGSNREGLNYRQLRSFIIPWPKINTRTCIAATLDAADARIRAEEATLAKLRQVKRGLMDDLLTGRVRVK